MVVSYYIISLFFRFFFFKQKTAYEMRISDWSSDVCSSDLSGMIVIGGRDQIVPPESVQKLVDKLRQQRGIEIDHRIIPDANHFFGEQIEELTGEVDDYLDTALKRDGKDRAAG